MAADLLPCPACQTTLSIHGDYVVCRVDGCGWKARHDYWRDHSERHHAELDRIASLIRSVPPELTERFAQQVAEAVDRCPMAVDLLPCPFCGGAARIINTPTIAWICRAMGRAASCGGCGVMFGGAFKDEDAIAAWNTRAPSRVATPATTVQPEPADRQRLGKLLDTKREFDDGYADADDVMCSLNDCLTDLHSLYATMPATPPAAPAAVTEAAISAGLSAFFATYSGPINLDRANVALNAALAAAAASEKGLGEKP